MVIALPFNFLGHLIFLAFLVFGVVFEKKHQIHLSVDNGWFGCFFQEARAKRSGLRGDFEDYFAPCKKNARQAVAVAFHYEKKPLEGGK